LLHRTWSFSPGTQRCSSFTRPPGP
jgi:hypothetical protein